MIRLTTLESEKTLGRRRIGWLMLGAGTIITFYFATVLWLASFDWGLVIPLLAGVALIIDGYGKIRRPEPVLSRPQQMLKKTAYFILILGLISFLVVEGMIIHSAIASRETQADYVLVLGAGIRGEQIPPLLEGRMNCALQYLNTYPDSQAILSGGQGSGERITEAEAMQRYLLQNGIAESRIIKEEKATSTFENISNTKAILAQRSQPGNTKIIIVSNDFHLFRATMLAQRVGLDASGLGCQTALIDIPHCYIREYFAVIKSLAMDKA